MKSTSKTRKLQRHIRIRSTLSGTSSRPRLSVSRSVHHIQAQLIDDGTGKTLFGISDLSLSLKGTKQERAAEIGKKIAEEAKKKGITTIVFDRGGHRFHGRVKALAEAARSAGLIF